MRRKENYLLKSKLCDLKLNSKTTSKSLKQNILNKNTGITLVALVVTIVVLLILAGITITLVFSDNGVIAKANKAKEETQKAQEQEAKDLQGLVDQIDDVFDESELAKLIQSGKIVDTNTIVTDRTGKTITVPAGFKVTSDCQLVDNGVVIEDADGNQFVWVPVDGTSLKYEKHVYDTPIVDDTSADNVTDTGNGNWLTYNYRKYTDWEETADIDANKASVEANGGFYIARYEAGAPEEADFYANGTTKTTYLQNYSNETINDVNYSSTYSKAKDTTTYTPISKKGAPAWNYITQINAKIVSANMYDSSTSSVRSQLMDSYAWSTVLQWLSNSGYDVKESKDWENNYNSSFTIDNDSLYAVHNIISDECTPALTYSYGTYTKEANTIVETATGAVEKNKANNIYDFAGNMQELITEEGFHKTPSGDVSTRKYCVQVGGSFNSPVGFTGASWCSGTLRIDGNWFGDTGFRVVLYIQNLGL